jgi:hypothetical protein
MRFVFRAVCLHDCGSQSIHMLYDRNLEPPYIIRIILDSLIFGVFVDILPLWAVQFSLPVPDRNWSNFNSKYYAISDPVLSIPSIHIIPETVEPIQIKLSNGVNTRLCLSNLILVCSVLHVKQEPALGVQSLCYNIYHLHEMQIINIRHVY